MSHERADNFDGGELQLVKTVKDAPGYSNLNYTAGQTIRSTGGHDTVRSQPFPQDTNPTVANATRRSQTK